ncbi:hypothetical protein GCM10009623_34420 [Nocardioides aestuarii]
MLSLALAFGTAGTANAASQPWVTKKEYRKVRVDMGKAKVHAIFDTKGQLAIPAGDGHPYMSRHYRTKWNGTKKCIAIDFEKDGQKWRVVGKSRPWRDSPGGGCLY